MKKKNNNFKIAFCGILCAINCVLLYLGSILDVFDYTVSALCGIIVTLAIIEFGNGAGVSVWLGTSAICLFILPQKFSSLLFVAFCGWYPFAKKVFERRKPLISYVLKFLVFNLTLFAIFFITVKFFALENITPLIIWGVWGLSNFTFFIYDTLITRLIFLWFVKFRKRFTFLK